MLYLTGIEQNVKGDKIAISYNQDYSSSKTTFSASIFNQKFYAYMKDIDAEFKTLCHLGYATNYAITGFKVRDVNEGASQEIQFIIDINTGIIAFENAKTRWREMREVPLTIYGADEHEPRKKAEAMNNIIDVFNQFQEYVRDMMPTWLEMGEDNGQLSLFDSTPSENITEAVIKNIEKGVSPEARQFRDNLQRLADQDGITTTISVQGREIAKVAPRQ